MQFFRFIYLPLLILLFTFCTEEGEDMYNLTITATPEEGGVVSNLSGDYEDGTIVEITASPNENWLFEGWQGDLTDNNPRVQVLMDSDKDIAAVFAKRNYPLSIEIEGEGFVAEEIVTQKTTEYPHGTVVELTAEPEDGWQFLRWEGDLTGSENPAQIQIENETSVKAIFAPVTFNLTVETEGEGVVIKELEQSKTTEYGEGDRVNLTAEPEEGWLFAGWEGDLDGSDNPVVITMDSNKTVTAVFLRFYTLNTSVEPENGGSISPDGGEFIRDSEVEVEAIPTGSGWKFDRWEGDFSGSLNPISLTMNGNKTLVAFFNRKEFLLEIEIDGEGIVEQELISGTATNNGYLFESEVELTATAEEGWNFIGWQGDISSDDNPLFILIDDNYSVTAVFQEDDNEQEDNDEEEENGEDDPDSEGT